MFKFFLKLLLALFVVIIAVVGFAFMMGNRYPIGRQLRSVSQDFIELYQQKRSVEDEKIRVKNLEILATTGIGDGCDFSARKADAENRDLYNAIQSAKKNKRAISFVDAELCFAQLDEIDLSEANLNGANLDGAYLANANLRGTFFVRSRLAGAKLQGTNLRNAHLDLADLSIAKLGGADLTGAGLYEAVLVMTDLSDANLTKASLREAVIYNIRSNNTKFVEADFKDARIITKFAKSADFTNAKFDGWIMRSFNTLSIWTLLIWQGIKNKIEDKMR